MDRRFRILYLLLGLFCLCFAGYFINMFIGVFEFGFHVMALLQLLVLLPLGILAPLCCGGFYLYRFFKILLVGKDIKD